MSASLLRSILKRKFIFNVLSLVFIDMISRKAKLTHPGGRGVGSGFLQEPTGSFKLVVLRLELDGGQPDLLAVGVGLERQGKDTSRRRHVTLA